MWGYKPIPGAKTPDEEKKMLDQWAREQDAKPYLRFSTANSFGSDPGENTEAVGDGDAIVSTALGIKNLKRVADMLLPATSHPGEPYDDLERALRTDAGPVGHRAESRHRDRGRFQLAAETRWSGWSALRDGSQRTSGGSSTLS